MREAPMREAPMREEIDVKNHIVHQLQQVHQIIVLHMEKKRKKTVKKIDVKNQIVHQVLKVKQTIV